MNSQNKPAIINMQPKNIELNIPIIFNKKLNKSTIKALKFINSDTGKTRHYTPAAQEWFNSIYTYNKNYTKSLPIIDQNLMKLLKSYFNIFINHNILNTKRIANRYKRLSSKKIFVGKGELKHTNSKVLITFYVYNTEKLYLKREINQLFSSLYLPRKELKKYINIDKEGIETITYNRPFTLNEFLERPDNNELYYSNNIYLKLTTYFDIYYSIIISLINKLTTYLEVILVYYEYLTKLVEKKVLNEYEKLLIFKFKANNFYAYEYPKCDNYIEMAKENYLKKLNRFMYLLRINNAKFEEPFIGKLSYLVEKLYNKKVEFNIVNLKKMHLNSDIFTQAVALKLKNRNNNLFRVLTLSLSKVNLPNVSRLSDKYSEFNWNEYLANRIRNIYIKDMFNSVTKKDSLNQLLLNFFPSTENLDIKIRNKWLQKNYPVSFNNYILKSLKHLKLSGVRVEAKGRLTKRFTASKSVFKLKWKGGLKNVDSSFKGLSAVMLRGNVTSNIQYTMSKSKNRNGAFGVKGWVSNK